jgi:hypothetical protein
MSDLVARLDAALLGYGEDIILRRVSGTAPNQTNVDVACRARVDAISVAQIVAGIPATDLNIIISPTQIVSANWPAVGSSPIPRMNGPDKVIMRGAAPRTIAFVDPKIINGELVRINMRVTGVG